LLEAISELRELFPDWRLGQLIANLERFPMASHTRSDHETSQGYRFG
jgi:hypothetical protein